MSLQHVVRQRICHLTYDHKANATARGAKKKKSTKAEGSSMDMLMLCLCLCQWWACSKEIMKVSWYLKQNINTEVGKYLEDISICFKELGTRTNKLKTSNDGFTTNEFIHRMEFIHYCHQCCLKPASQKIAGTLHWNPLTLGEIRDDAKLDLYYTNIREDHVPCSPIFTKDICSRSSVN